MTQEPKRDEITPDPKDQEFRDYVTRVVVRPYDREVLIRLHSEAMEATEEKLAKLQALRADDILQAAKDVVVPWASEANRVRIENQRLSERVRELEAENEAMKPCVEHLAEAAKERAEAAADRKFAALVLEGQFANPAQLRLEVERLSSELERAKEEQRLSRSVHDPAKCEECTHVGYENTIKDLEAELEQVKKGWTAIEAERDEFHDLWEESVKECEQMKKGREDGLAEARRAWRHWSDAVAENARLASQVSGLEKERAEALAALMPASPSETLIGAIRNLQQAHISERSNADTLETQVSRLREAAYKQISKAEACHNDSTFQDGMKHAAEEILKALQTPTPEPRKPAPYHPYMSCCQSAEIHESTGCMAYSTPESLTTKKCIGCTGSGEPTEPPAATPGEICRWCLAVNINCTEHCSTPEPPVVPEKANDSPGDKYEALILEHAKKVGKRWAGPDSPGAVVVETHHICGDPYAACDGECAERYYESLRCRGAVDGFDHGNPTTYQCHRNIPCSDHPKDKGEPGLDCGCPVFPGHEWELCPQNPRWAEPSPENPAKGCGSPVGMSGYVKVTCGLGGALCNKCDSPGARVVVTPESMEHVADRLANPEPTEALKGLMGEQERCREQVLRSGYLDDFEQSDCGMLLPCPSHPKATPSEAQK